MRTIHIVKEDFDDDDLDFIKAVVFDPRGVSQLDTFEFRDGDKNDDVDIVIHKKSVQDLRRAGVLSGRAMERKYGNLNLCVWTPDGSNIYVHAKHWRKAPSGVLESEVVRDDAEMFRGCVDEEEYKQRVYRAYVVTHEMLHALGLFEHADDTGAGSLCPTLYQQTKKKKDGCILNPWFLRDDVIDQLVGDL